MTHNKIIEELMAENEKLQSNMNLHFSETFKLQEENKKLKQQIDNFYYEKSKLKETDFYIKVLKNQLFKSYLIQQHNERLITKLQKENKEQIIYIEKLKNEILQFYI